MHLSKTDGVQKAFKNGSQAYSKPRTDNANYNVNGSSFIFHSMEAVVWRQWLCI